MWLDALTKDKPAVLLITVTRAVLLRKLIKMKNIIEYINDELDISHLSNIVLAFTHITLFMKLNI